MRFFRSRARPFPGAAVYIGTACVQDTIITVRMKYSRHSPIVRAVFSTGLRKCMRLLVRYVYQEHTQMTIQLTTCHSALRHGFRRMSSSSFGIHVISRDCRPNHPTRAIPHFRSCGSNDTFDITGQALELLAGRRKRRSSNRCEQMRGEQR